MSDTTQGEVTTIEVPITKGKSTITVNLAEIPDDVYKEVILQGLKVILNRGMSKITASDIPNEDQRKESAMKTAEKNLEDVKTSKIKFSGGTKAKKVSGVVMTEARRLAKQLVKDEMKRAGIKVSYVDAKEITALANALLDEDPSIIEEAKANIEKRESVSEIKIDVKSIKINEKKKAAAEAKKAEAKAQLSKTQAGKTAKRAKPQAEANA